MKTKISKLFYKWNEFAKETLAYDAKELKFSKADMKRIESLDYKSLSYTMATIYKCEPNDSEYRVSIRTWAALAVVKAYEKIFVSLDRNHAIKCANDIINKHGVTVEKKL